MREESMGRQIGKFVLPIVILVPLIVAGAAASVWLGGAFSWRGYSDRVFWGGIGAFIVAGLGVLASLG